jgi:hypothetical protein
MYFNSENTLLPKLVGAQTVAASATSFFFGRLVLTRHAHLLQLKQIKLEQGVSGFV